MAKHLIPSDRTIQVMKADVSRLNDGAGLHIRQSAAGKHWYQDFTFNGQRTSLSLGAYPEIGLAEARRRSHDMRTDVAHGIDPAAKRRDEKKFELQRQEAKRLLGCEDAVPGSFEHLARAWYKKRTSGWSKDHADKVMVRMEKHLFPALGYRAIAKIQRVEYTQLLMDIDHEGKTSTANRLHSICQRICSYAVAHQYLDANPTPEVKEVLRTEITKHHAAITKPEQLQEFVQSVHAYHGTFVVTCALKLMMNTFLRSTEFRWAQWSEIDFENMVWMVPADRMKDTMEKKLNGAPHMVPLSLQSIEILRQLFAITGRTIYVFAGQGSKNPVLSENTLNKAIRAMGYSTQDDQSTHGFRATARTMLVEQLGWHKDIVELQLDHQVSDANGGAYNRVQLDQARREMMQDWSDYLEQLHLGPIPKSVKHHTKSASPKSAISRGFTTPFVTGKGKDFLHEYSGSNVIKTIWTIPRVVLSMRPTSITFAAIPIHHTKRSSP